MKKWRLPLIILLGILQLSALAAPKEKKEKAEKPERVYMYGISIDFNDSTVYLTDVQHLDSIVINPDGSIHNHSGYSLQLRVYLEDCLGERNQTCAVVYSPKKRKLEKRFLATRRKYQHDKTKTIKFIGTDDFVFQRH